ncbi:MAG: hypothetical protein ACI8Z1_004057 [Candidatus Azotimanducaceae bacterium]|jgi:hypothetical protein
MADEPSRRYLWEYLFVAIDRATLVLSRLRSGLPTRLCGLSLKCQGAFAA